MRPILGPLLKRWEVLSSLASPVCLKWPLSLMSSLIDKETEAWWRSPTAEVPVLSSHFVTPRHVRGGGHSGHQSMRSQGSRSNNGSRTMSS